MALEIVISGTEDYLGGEAFIKALIMGEPGAGKTRSASFWPKPIFADCENGRMSVADRALPVAKVRTPADMEQLLLLCKQESTKPVEDRRFRTLVIDTFDAYQRIVIQERLRKEKKDRLSGWDDWGYLDAKTAQLLERLQNLPLNVVVNMHVKEATEGSGDDKLVYLRPHLKGDVRDQIAAEFDLVGFMETYWGVDPDAKEPKRIQRRRIQWAPDPKHPMLKDRSGQLPFYTEIDFTEEDFTRIFLPIVGKLDELPESEAFLTVATADDKTPPPAPVTEAKGGPTNPAPEPVAKAAPKAPAKRAAPRKTTGADPAPPPEPTSEPPTDVATPAVLEVEPPAGVDTTTGEIAPVPTPEQALATVQDSLGGTVISETDEADTTPEPATPASDPVAALTCGDGPGPYKGCGKDLAGENQDIVGLSFIKYRNYLCQADYKAAKAGQAEKN